MCSLACRTGVFFFYEHAVSTRRGEHETKRAQGLRVTRDGGCTKNILLPARRHTNQLAYEMLLLSQTFLAVSKLIKL